MVAARDAKLRRVEQVNSTIVRASEALRIQQGGSVRGWISVENWYMEHKTCEQRDKRCSATSSAPT